MLDGFQGVGVGIFRGIGRQTIVAVLNAGAFWVVGIPVGAYLGFERDMGVTGLWCGLSVGLFGACVAYFFVMRGIDWQREAEKAAARCCLEARAGGAALDKVQPLMADGDTSFPLSQES